MATHGTRSAYVRWGCRCEACTVAHRTYCAEQRSRRHAFTAEHGLPRSVKHGGSAYTNWGCRCDTCTDAWAAAKQRQRAANPPR